MRQLLYTNYQSGNSGLSNAIMSIECGVVMAFLTKRFLLLDGNTSPPANIVSYSGRVDNRQPSRVTDLLDIPVPWKELDAREIADLRAEELAQQHLMDSVFYVPGSVDIHSADALDFARGRRHWICEDETLAEVPLLRVSEDPTIPGSDAHRHNLSFYSYLFYLDDENRRAVYELLSRMQAQAPYAELATRVAADLGAFNAVHMRRGDFKVTYGVTVLDRSPWEAIEAMDRHFSREQRLLICTDERDDPFFEEITRAWSDHVFIDHHILDNYGSEFANLPQHDSLALAYLSQLVAAESIDFIGSMTSTYTSMIQRMRGNRGKHEPFKFLWNELPTPGDSVERGSHPVSECVPLEDGIMIPQFEGPYSWNRYSQLINPAWMREWPESFLTQQVLQSGRLSPKPSTASIATLMPRASASRDRHADASVTVYFRDVSLKVNSSWPGLLPAVGDAFPRPDDASEGNVVAELEVDFRGGYLLLSSGSNPVAEIRETGALASAIVDYFVPILCRVRQGQSWFDGMLIERGESRLLLVGDWRGDSGDASPPLALADAGWTVLADEALPVDAKTAFAQPFARCSLQAGAPANLGSCELSAVVYCSLQLHCRSSLFALPPSAAVAELARTTRDFALDRDRTIQRLCALVEKVPTYQLNYARVDDMAPVLRALENAGQGPTVGIPA